MKLSHWQRLNRWWFFRRLSPKERALFLKLEQYQASLTEWREQSLEPGLQRIAQIVSESEAQS